jgi:hypothetical protein
MQNNDKGPFNLLGQVFGAIVAGGLVAIFVALVIRIMKWILGS